MTTKTNNEIELTPAQHAKLNKWIVAQTRRIEENRSKALGKMCRTVMEKMERMGKGKGMGKHNEKGL